VPERKPRERPAPGPASEPTPRPVPAPVPPRRREGGGSLWSSNRPTTEAGATPTPASAPRPKPPAPDALDLNAATVDQLAMLPGIGRGAAARVIAHREANGPFHTVHGLAEVEGFDVARVNRVAARLRV
jgi:competence protein ComEA